jgi:hypothetical protein
MQSTEVDQDDIEAVAREVLRLERKWLEKPRGLRYADVLSAADAAPRLAAEALRLREVMREYCVCGLEITTLEADRD